MVLAIYYRGRRAKQVDFVTEILDITSYCSLKVDPDCLTVILRTLGYYINQARSSLQLMIMHRVAVGDIQQLSNQRFPPVELASN